MKFIKPSFEIINQPGYNLADIHKHIELCGRTCYKSTDKITDDSASPFVERMIKSKHNAMLEHGTVYLLMPSDEALKYVFENHSYLHDFKNNKQYSGKSAVTTNLRVIIEKKWQDDLQYLCEPIKGYHKLRVTVKFICNRQVSHEFVRHRVFSFAQESTRYCNYTKDKFGSELTFIKPLWFDDSKWYCKAALKACFKGIEIAYNFLVKRGGWKPQQAATALPNALKTELIMTGFVHDWIHYFSLRAFGLTGAPHPQAKELALPLAIEFDKRKLI